MATTDDDLIDLERRAVQLTAGPYLEAVASIRLLLAGKAPGLVEALLALVAPSIGERGAAIIAEAYSLGIMDAAEVMTAEERHRARRVISASRPTLDLVRAATSLVVGSREAIRKSQALVRAGVDPEVAVGPVLADATRIDRDIRTVVNEARSAAVESASVAAGLPMTIESERDACVICLAYAGKVSVDGRFPVGLTYGEATPSHLDKTEQKVPIHPRCRCRLVTLKDPRYAAALEREAKRSILRGYALPSESERMRLRAAERLLEQGSGMPKSVDAFARKAVKAGKFPERNAPQGAKLAGG